MASGTPDLAHASAHALCPGPDAPFVVLQFTSITWPVIVISLPAVAAWPCAASGSAHTASTAAQARIRFSIGASSMSGDSRTHSVGTRPAARPSRRPEYHTPGLGLPDWAILGAMNEAYRALLEAFRRAWEHGD